jgi:hypothetical protein
MERLRVRRRRSRRNVALGLVILVLAAGAAAMVALGRHHHPRPFILRPAPSSLAWGFQEGSQTFTAIIAVPRGRPPVAVAVPPATLIDVPGAPPTMGAASTSGGLLIASMQAALNRRVGHYLLSRPEDIRALVDALGGITVTVEVSFDFGGRQVLPGSRRLSGAAVEAYLGAGTPIDATGRWEEVLTGILAGPADPSRWSGTFGTTDDGAAVTALLVSAHGATVTELATSPGQVKGTQIADQKAVAALLDRLGTAVGPLVHVIVLNGNGRPGMGAAVAQLVAPAGYRVVASQNAVSFGVRGTKIVAGDEGFLAAARQVRALLGRGRVYVGSVPTNIGDITVVVGKDFQAG